MLIPHLDGDCASSALGQEVSTDVGRSLGRIPFRSIYIRKLVASFVLNEVAVFPNVEIEKGQTLSAPAVRR